MCMQVSEDKSNRGARLEEDFLSQQHTQQAEPLSSDKTLEDTRLSDVSICQSAPNPCHVPHWFRTMIGDSMLV